MTATLAALFIATNLVLAYMGSRRTEAPTSVIDRVQTQSKDSASKAPNDDPGKNQGVPALPQAPAADSTSQPVEAAPAAPAADESQTPK